MLTFVALCLLARLAYSLNDVLIGRVARRQSRMETAAFRGVSLGVSMAPWLLLVPASAWGALSGQLGPLLGTVALTALANILQLQAVRFLPFGLRAALMLSSMATGSVLLGWLLLGERLTPLEVALCVVLVGSAVMVALGQHATLEIELNVPRGAALTLAAGSVMVCAVLGVKHLATTTHPLLAAWAWEFGAGLILLPAALLRARGATPGVLAERFWRVALAALPTALASGASVLALGFGQLGLWGALGGTQILFTAALGAVWHHETLGWRRALAMLATVTAVASLALVRA
jgi:drug/metabolite transporter (DMT)-like permease